MRWWMIGSLSAGLSMLGVSFLVAEYSAWLSNALTGLGVTVFLLVPGAWITFRVQSAVARVTEVAEDARSVAEDARLTSERTASALADIEGKIVEDQLHDYSSHVDVYRRVLKDHSRDAVVEALHRAVRESILSPRIVLSRIWETSLYYRFICPEGNDFLRISIENLSGKVLSTSEWKKGVESKEFYEVLVGAVRSIGADLGVGLNVPTESVRHLFEMLVKVAELRAQELRGYRQILTQIVKSEGDGVDGGDGWIFTENALMPMSDLTYVIEYNRLDETDWSEHLRRKGWHGVDRALADAKEIQRRLSDGGYQQSGGEFL